MSKKNLQATNIKEHIDDMAALSQSLSGCLSAREVRFLAPAAVDRVYGMDALYLPSATVPPVESGENLPDG